MPKKDTLKAAAKAAPKPKAAKTTKPKFAKTPKLKKPEKKKAEKTKPAKKGADSFTPIVMTERAQVVSS